MLTICCLGDSLTEGDYGVFGKSGIANVQDQNYPYFLSEMLEAEVRNFGKCGYNSTSYLAHYKNGNVSLAGADYIIIMLGTNGGLNADEEVKGNQDYRELIELCRKDAPDAKIILCTPPHVTVNPFYSNCGYAPQVEQAVRFVRQYAAEKQTDMIDLAACPAFSAESEAVMQPNDGLHFSEIGYQTMAKFIADELKKRKEGK